MAEAGAPEPRSVPALAVSGGGGRLLDEGFSDIPGSESWGEISVPVSLHDAEGRQWRARAIHLTQLEFADEDWQRSWQRIRGAPPLPSETGTVIVAHPADEIAAAARALRKTLFLIGAIGLVIGFVITRANRGEGHGAAPALPGAGRGPRTPPLSTAVSRPRAFRPSLQGVAEALNEALARLEGLLRSRAADRRQPRARTAHAPSRSCRA